MIRFGLIAPFYHSRWLYCYRAAADFVTQLAPKPVFDVTGVGSDDEKAALTTTFCQKAGIVLAAQ